MVGPRCLGPAFQKGQVRGFCAGPFCSSSRAGGLRGQGGQRGSGQQSRGLWTQRSPFSACSIHNGVIAVFQHKGLPDQELFSLNEGVR